MVISVIGTQYDGIMIIDGGGGGGGGGGHRHAYVSMLTVFGHVEASPLTEVVLCVRVPVWLSGTCCALWLLRVQLLMAC